MPVCSVICRRQVTQDKREAAADPPHDLEQKPDDEFPDLRGKLQTAAQEEGSGILEDCNGERAPPRGD